MKSKSPKILIVEDEPVIALDIEMLLEDLNYEITNIEDNAEDAIKSMEDNLPDLVLLDINIEGDVDGVMLAEEINEKFGIPFVFLTSNADKLTINRVKRTNPSGFIVKPFSEKDLQSNIEIALFSKKEDNSKIKEDTSTDFFVKEGNSLVKVKINELMFAKADDNYTRLFTLEKSHILSSTMKKVEEKLPDNFIRIHRSYIININFIDKIKDSFLYIGKHQLPIGRSYQESLFKKINKL